MALAVKERSEPPVTLDLALKHGLTAEEFGRITGILGRNPTYTELGIYSVMWSEHCSYKNSIAVLKTLPREGRRLLVGAGEENAGLVDIGEGMAVAFKIESHNHPSAVEPYQGAAGFIFPPAGWLQRLESWARERGLIFILDEKDAEALAKFPPASDGAKN